MMGNNPKLDLVNVEVHTKLAGNNTKLDLVNVDVHTKFGQNSAPDNF